LVLLIAALIGLALWDWAYQGQFYRWWQGERVYGYYWRELALFVSLAVITAGALWMLSVAVLSKAPESMESSEDSFTDAALFGSASHLTICVLAIPLLLLFFARYWWHPLGMTPGSSAWTYLLLAVVSAVLTTLLVEPLRRLGPSRRLGRVAPRLVWTMIILYFTVFGFLAVARHQSFRTHALDMGTMTQAVWNTAHGRLWERTPLYLPLGTPPRRDSRLVSGKLELVFLPLALLYRLWPDPRLLLLVQTAALAVAAWPLYLLARHRLQDSFLALFIAATYLLYLPLHYATMFEFHPPVLMVPGLAWAALGMVQRRWRLYYLGLGLAFLCRVDAAFIAVGLALYLLLRRERRVALVTLGLAALWLGVDFGLVMPWAKAAYGVGDSDLLTRRFGYLGRGPWGIMLGALTRPRWLVSTLLEREKLQTFFDLGMPLGFLPLLAPAALLPALPVLVINLLALSQWQGTVHAHYMAPLIPFLFVALVEGLQRLRSFRPLLGSSVLRVARLSRLSCFVPFESFVFFVLINTLLIAVFFSPFPPGKDFRLGDFWQCTVHQEALQRMVARVPPGVPVSAQSDIFPHLAHRRDIYLFPYIADARYIILDLDFTAEKSPLGYHDFYWRVERLPEEASFGVVAFDNGVLLLERGAPRDNLPRIREEIAAYGRGFFRVDYRSYDEPRHLRADELYRVRVTVTNAGSQFWSSRGWYPVRLTYRWLSPSGQPVADGLRTELAHLVSPGQTVTLRAWLLTPPRPGRYILEWDMVREGDTWFSAQGAETLRVPVAVGHIQ